MASTTKNPQLDTLRALVAFARGLERDAKTQTDLGFYGYAQTLRIQAEGARYAVRVAYRAMGGDPR